MSEVLSLHNVTHTYHQGGQDLTVLNTIHMTVKSGEMVALVGASGSGKSTLLHIAGLLDVPSQGHVSILGQNMPKSDDKRTRTRLKSIGFVYQFHHLLPEFSALENVMIPQMIAGVSTSLSQKNAKTYLEKMGLSHRLTHRPSQLSGGEQQRVAIARALANKPALLLADEPTGNLDEVTAQKVLDQLITLVREEGLAAVIATHDMNLVKRMDRVLTLHHGVLE